MCIHQARRYCVVYRSYNPINRVTLNILPGSIIQKYKRQTYTFNRAIYKTQSLSAQYAHAIKAVHFACQCTLAVMLILVLKDALRTISQVLVLDSQVLVLILVLVVLSLSLSLPLVLTKVFYPRFFQWFTTDNGLNRNASLQFPLTYISCYSWLPF